MQHGGVSEEGHITQRHENLARAKLNIRDETGALKSEETKHTEAVCFVFMNLRAQKDS